ncbi:hypothetical protein [Kitasatospora sp. NBC_01266]|uniref:hypothetical protein n=1 Tax=Kitasatospora sp. NBC_01266 TaxID=2903572 RepID=UPI002E2ED2CA|nr:hypothetical protein [Kitasatospora sp. NBC_01266]
MTTSTTAQVVGRALRIPDRYREFDIPWDTVLTVYRVPRPLLDELLDLGLPHRGRGEERRFDLFDLENLTTALEINAPNWVLMRALGHTYDRDIGRTDDAYRLQVTARCPEPGHAGDCDVAAAPLLLPAPEEADDLRYEPPSTIVRRVALPADEYYFEDSVLPLFEPAEQLTFYLIPTDLSTDLGFAAETGLADCRLANRLLLDRARRAVVESRIASGLIMAAPLPLRHMWIEVRVGDRWIAADPFFIQTLTRWRIISPHKWPVRRSPRRIYWPIAGSPLPEDMSLATHRGSKVRGSARITNWRQR